MASINWKKYKSAIEVKALIRHNEQECRKRTKEHNNQHIDKTKTSLNYSFMCMSYEERCQKFDDIIADVERKSKRAIRKDAVLCLSLETAIPEHLPKGKEREWFQQYHNILCGFFGAENILDTDVHYDEIHEYIHAETHEKTFSRPHAHTLIVPRTSDNRLCCKKISERENMIKLNRQVGEMTQQYFGVKFNNGNEINKKSVEQLKAESLKLELKEVQNNVDILCDSMKKAPKRKFKISNIFKKNDDTTYTMNQQDYENFIQFGESIKRSAHNTLTVDEEREKIKQEREEYERLKENEELYIKQKAEEMAKQQINNVMLGLQKQKQQVEQEKQRYKQLCQNSEKLIEQRAIAIADKMSSSFKRQDIKRKNQLLKDFVTDNTSFDFKQQTNDYECER